MVLALNALIYFLPGGYSSQVKSIFWLGSLGIVFQGFYTSCNAWFQYKLSYWSSTLSVVAGSVVSAALTMYYVVRSPTLPHLVFSSMLGYVVMALVSYLCLPPLDSKLWNTKLVVSLLQRSLILGLILIANVIAIKSDTVILGIFKSSGEVGQYGFAYRIFEVILVLPVFVINAIYPLSLKENSSTFKSSIYDKTVKYLAIMSLGISGATWIVAPYLYLVKPELSLSIVVLRLLAFTIPLFYVTAPLMWSLIRQKRDKLVLLIYVCAAALNFTLNFTFIPSFGATAAAINTGVTELFIFLVLYYFSIKK